MGNYDEKAGRLQDATRESELEKGCEYPESQVSCSIVHTREDVVLLVSLCSSARLAAPINFRMCSRSRAWRRMSQAMRRSYITYPYRG